MLLIRIGRTSQTGQTSRTVRPYDRSAVFNFLTLFSEYISTEGDNLLKFQKLKLNEILKLNSFAVPANLDNYIFFALYLLKQLQGPLFAGNLSPH